MSLILVIEDEKPISRLIKDKLESTGFKVEIAHDGDSGFNKALELHPDLILLDIILPKTDGITTLKKLRKTNDWGSKVPVIVLSNLVPDSKELNQDISETKPVFYLIKANWKLDDIMTKVKEILPD